MTREELRDYVDEQRAQDIIPYHVYSALIDGIDTLEQEPKTGYREYNDIYDHYLCGNCKTVVMDYDNYCPNCGARLVEEQEGANK
jgi:rubrerythrin